MTEKRFQYNVNKNTIEQDGKFVAYMNSVDGARIANKLNELAEENEQLKQQLSNIDGQLVMLDKCDNWDYDRMKHTVREIAKIIGYNGTINPKKVMCNDRIN